MTVLTFLRDLAVSYPVLSPLWRYSHLLALSLSPSLPLLYLYLHLYLYLLHSLPLLNLFQPYDYQVYFLEEEKGEKKERIRFHVFDYFLSIFMITFSECPSLRVSELFRGQLLLILMNTSSVSMQPPRKEKIN